jgi:hypothetical protein
MLAKVRGTHEYIYITEFCREPMQAIYSMCTKAVTRLAFSLIKRSILPCSLHY